MTFKLSDFKQKPFTHRSSHKNGRTFPMRILGSGKIFVDDVMVDALEGEDLSKNKERVMVYLRPYGGNRPEIVDFVTDRAKEIAEAVQKGDYDFTEKVARNPANHVYTEFGGVILVENAFFNESVKCYEAGWLRTLIRKASDEVTGVTMIEAPVWARVNPVSSHDGSIRASLDVIYPNLASASGSKSAEELDYQICSQLDNFSMKGQRFAVIVFKREQETVVNTIFSRTVAERLDDGNETGRYISLSSDVLLKEFWGQFPESCVKDLRQQIGLSVSAVVIPGVRYYYLTDKSKGIAIQESKLASLSRKFAATSEEMGFLPCVVALRMHMNSQSMFPIKDGLWPVMRNLSPVLMSDVLSYRIEKDGSYKSI